MNGMYYPQPQYYPMYEKKNTGMVIVGLVVAGLAGGYLYFAYKNKWWPFDGGWDPDPKDNCTGGCNFNGSKRCKSGDLCECVNNQWTLKDSGSSLCGTGATTHLACFNSQNNIITCVEDAGPGTDQCYALGYSGGCPCDIPVGTCDALSWCNPADNSCIEMANNVFVNDGQTESNPELYVALSAPFAANRMSYCRVDYTDGNPIGGIITWSFWGVYNGVETKICEGTYGYVGSEGYFWIPANVSHELPWGFPVQGFEQMKVQFGSGESVKAFQGTFDFS